MRFILGVLWGYYIRGKKRLLIITLTVFIVLIIMCSVVLPAIALSILALDVMRERASRPPQTSVPSLVGLKYESVETKVHKANLNIRILAHRYDVPNEPCTIIFQTPQAGERVSHGTFVGVVVSNRDWNNPKPCSSHSEWPRYE
jgi:beta-lactam-binding protein with PASTA domain